MRGMIVITGSIATGKSTVCELLREQKYSIIDADGIAHSVLDQNCQNISELFGSEYIIDGHVDRKKLGSLIFKNKDEKQKLENLLHPLIREIILKKCNELSAREKLFFVDIPLFYETKAYPFDNVAVVYAPRKVQIQRLMQRNNMSVEDALERIDSQIDIETKKQKADFVIDNSGSKEALKETLKIFLQRITG